RGGIEPVYSIESGAHLEAAFYRNSAVHWFVDRAIMELSVLAAIEPAEDHLRAGWQEAFRLRDLLKFEFFFPDRAEFSERITAEMVLVDPEWHNRGRETRGSEIVARLRGSGFMMAHRVLRAFFDAQLVVAERLADKDAAAPIDRKELVAECVSVGKQMLLQRRLHSPESVSTELFGGAIKLADNYHLIEPADPAAADARADLTRRRNDFAAELRAIGARISLAATLDPSNTLGPVPRWTRCSNGPAPARADPRCSRSSTSRRCSTGSPRPRCCAAPCPAAPATPPPASCSTATTPRSPTAATAGSCTAPRPGWPDAPAPNSTN